MNTSASNQPSAAKTVFISYSHEDRVSAEKLAAALQEAGIAVIIDSEMRGGQEIQRFIKNSIKSADVTISLVSENSLLSGWVAKETISALDLYKEVPGKEFIGCYLDENFFKPDFRLKATKTIDEKIAEIDELFPEYSKGKLDFKDLHTERSRLIDLRKELGVILSELKNSLTLDLRDQNFGRNVAKLIADIQSSSDKTEPASATTTSDTPVLLRTRRRLRASWDSAACQGLSDDGNSSQLGARGLSPIEVSRASKTEAFGPGVAQPTLLIFIEFHPKISYF